MSRRLMVQIMVGTRRQLIERQSMELAQPIQDGAFTTRLGNAIELGTVTGGEHCRFMHPRQSAQFSQRRLELGGGKGYPLTHRNSGRSVVDSKGKKRHASSVLGNSTGIVKP